MNIPSKSDKFHLFYGKAKYAFLAVFVLTIMFSSFVSHRVYGDSVIGTVETKVALRIDGRIVNLVTTQNTIEGALSQNHISLAKNDITVPPLDTYLSGKAIDVQVVRAVPVLISDNGQSWAATSAYTQPLDILKQLNVEIFPEDKVSAELILDPAAEGTVGQKIIIERAPVFTIYVDDTTKVVRSWAATVGEMLTEKGITLGVNDLVEPPKTASLVGVSEITITRINYADIEETVAIPFQSVEQKDNNMYKGKSAVVQAGVNGSKKQNVHVVYRNGIEVERTVTSSLILQEAQNKITAIGVKPYSHQDLWAIMLQAEQKYGVSASNLYSVAVCETGADPSRNSGNGYYGMYQWDGSFSTWAAKAGYSGASVFDPTAQIFATALRVKNSSGYWSAWPSCGSGLRW